MTFLYLLASGTRYKIGIGKHVPRRVLEIDRTTKGRQRLLFALLFPFGAYQVEQYFHRRYRRYHAPYRVGSGKTEYFRAGFWVLDFIVIALISCLVRWLLVLAGCVGVLFTILNFGI